METVLPFAAWESFYVIVGSSAAALTGLQFVVIVLGAETNAIGAGDATRAYTTPTVVHFCAVLLVSAILSAPWPAMGGAAIALGACGVAGIVFVALVIAQTRRQAAYRPVLEDWLGHVVVPMVAYVALLEAAIALTVNPGVSLFAIGAAALVLLFSGIHNAWDSVMYIAFDRPG